MTKRPDLIRYRHMLDYASEAVAIMHDRNRSDLDRDRMLELALVRLLEVLGEAASRVSPEGQDRHSTIPWSQVAGMRNRLIHGYDEIDLDVLWDTVRDDLPLLIKELERAIRLEENKQLED